jgi:hypothetical protein
MPPAVPSAPPAGASASAGPAPLDARGRDRIVQAKSQVDEVYRLVDQLPRDQREMVKADSTKESSLALAERIRVLTMQLAEIDQALAGDAQARLETEIAKYEAQANPLEPASESRVRQLVALKRHRRALAEKATRRTVVARQLEECELALGMVRSHLARLVSAPGYGAAPEQNYQQVTMLVERALSVADRVDGAIHAVQEVDRMTSRPPGGR